MLSLGRGKAIEVIVNELESLGYDWAYRVVDARSFGLPQRRRRVYLVASRAGDPRDVLLAQDGGAPPTPETDGVACGFYWTEGLRGLGWTIDAVPTLKGGSSVGIPSPPAILMPDRRIIKLGITDAERLQGFRANWTKPAERVVRGSFRWRLVGNAVSVRAAEWLGRRLASPGRYESEHDEPLRKGARWPDAAWSKGGRRFASSVSPYPSSPKKSVSLADFLREEGTPLSIKAATGFRERARVSSLRFPEGFLQAVDDHLDRMRAVAANA